MGKKKSSAKKTEKKSTARKWWIWGSVASFSVLLTAAGIFSWFVFFTPNVTAGSSPAYVFVYSGELFDHFILRLENAPADKRPVKNLTTFKWVAGWLDLDKKLKPGRYQLKAGMNNLELVRLLRSGKQEPIQITLRKFHTPFEVAGYAGRQLESDSNSILNAMKKYFPDVLQKAMTVILPNTYEFYWNTSADGFVKRMKTESDRFWNANNRLQLLDSIHLSKDVAVVMASIVEEETALKEDKPKIACVYLNRIQKKMPLQADPTVKFAIGDFALRRVLNVHLKFESPYNTYLNDGLPPAPICNPSLESIDAVLHPLKKDWLYFCAAADFSGHSVFATTYAEHKKNARAYQKALDARGIH